VMVPCARAGAAGASARMTTIEIGNARNPFMENPCLDRAKEGLPGVNTVGVSLWPPATG
jgi:hypothetical protein